MKTQKKCKTHWENAGLNHNFRFWSSKNTATTMICCWLWFGAAWKKREKHSRGKPSGGLFLREFEASSSHREGLVSLVSFSSDIGPELHVSTKTVLTMDCTPVATGVVLGHATMFLDVDPKQFWPFFADGLLSVLGSCFTLFHLLLRSGLACDFLMRDAG